MKNKFIDWNGLGTVAEFGVPDSSNKFNAMPLKSDLCTRYCVMWISQRNLLNASAIFAISKHPGYSGVFGDVAERSIAAVFKHAGVLLAGGAPVGSNPTVSVETNNKRASVQRVPFLFQFAFARPDRLNKGSWFGRMPVYLTYPNGRALDSIGSLAMPSVLSDKHFHNEAEAYKWVEARVWPQGPTCPHCGGVERISKMEGKFNPLWNL